MKVNKLSAIIFASLISLFTLNGCNTMEGAGEDVEQVGDEIEEATDN